MNKSELIDAIGKTTGLARRDAENAVNAVVHTVISEVKAGRKVAVVGFGSFNPTRRPARTGRNPQTGAPVKIAASKGVRFGASSTFKNVVNGKAVLGAPKVVGGSSTTTTAAPAKKAVAKKAVAKKAVAKKAVAKKAVAKKAVATAAVATAAVAKKAVAKKAVAKKAVAKKAVAKKAVGRAR